MRIDPAALPTPAAGARAARRGRRSEGGFTLPGADEGAADEAGGAAELPALPGLSCLLPPEVAHAPAGADTAAEGAAAARQGRALLGALAGLQRAGLGGDGVQARQTLADLARALPESTDPRLDEVLRAIAQRAAIELARDG